MPYFLFSRATMALESLWDFSLWKMGFKLSVSLLSQNLSMTPDEVGN